MSRTEAWKKGIVGYAVSNFAMPKVVKSANTGAGVASISLLLENLLIRGGLRCILVRGVCYPFSLQHPMQPNQMHVHQQWSGLLYYGGRLNSDQETCDDMWTICKSCTRKEILACMSDPVKAKAKASADKSKENEVYVRVFAS